MTGDWRTSPPAADYAVDELMIATLAAQFRDGDQACNGMASFLPVAAFMLARLTHAPDLVWLASAAGLDPRPARIPASTLEAPLWRDSVMYIEQYGDFWDLALNGRWLKKFCVGAAQLDQYGNANNSIIGTSFTRPTIRLPGTAGLADMGSIGKTLYYWVPNHSPRTLVRKVDFVSAAGGYAQERAAGVAHRPAAREGRPVPHRVSRARAQSHSRGAAGTRRTGRLPVGSWQRPLPSDEFSDVERARRHGGQQRHSGNDGG